VKTRKRVLVTHADEPIGRALATRLIEDPSIEQLHTVGAPGGENPFEHRFALCPERFRHHEAHLHTPRDVEELFAASDPDAVILVPRASERIPRGRVRLADVPRRTVETRLILQQCLERTSVGQLVALGSMAAYELSPDNANHLDEDSPLALDPERPAAARAWVDCDMMLHAEVHHPTLSVALLRVAPVLTCEGDLVFAPADLGRISLRALGFDPMCPLVVDRDVVQAAMLALHLEARGVFNIAGDQSLPLSVIDRARRSFRLNLPGAWLSLLGRGFEQLGDGGWARRLDGPQQRFGASLDTRRAQRELGFRPGYRIALRASGAAGPSLEALPS
jgi:nucleoside-diphosphate-sugar epimerase